MGLYEAFRNAPFPTLYPDNKTAVTSDVLEVGLIFAFCIIAFSFFLVLPGIRGIERLYVFIRVIVSLYIGSVIILANFGQEWEIAEIHGVAMQYKAHTADEIHGDVSAKIGLRSINITLKGDSESEELLNEKIDYNERFHWAWRQGRNGFGPYSGRVNREFRDAQWKGLPYPVLWVAEYFTLDAEEIRWGRSYRIAGWYTHICLWTCFPLWLLSNILFFMVLRYGAYMLMLTGIVMLVGDVIYATLRFGVPLAIPVGTEVLTFYYGWCFWITLVTGVLCVLFGAIIIFMDYRFPDLVATFFGVDVLQEFEDTYVTNEDPKAEQLHGSMDNGSPTSLQTIEEGEEDDLYVNVAEVHHEFIARKPSRFQVSRRRPRPAPRDQHKEEILQEEPEFNEPVIKYSGGNDNGEETISMGKIKMVEA